MPQKSPLVIMGPESGSAWYQQSALRGIPAPVLASTTCQSSISHPSSSLAVTDGKNHIHMQYTKHNAIYAKYEKYVRNTQMNSFTLYFLSQQKTCFLLQGVYHHTQLYLISLIGADSLFLNPFLVSILRRITGGVDCITIPSNVTRVMLDTMVLSCSHNWGTMAVNIRKHFLTMLQIPEIC